MRIHLLRGLAVLCLLLLAQVCSAAPPDPVADMADLIDRVIDATIKEKKAVVAPVADDYEFCRRAYLDIAGRIPRVSETRAFAADKRSDKRRKLVEKLLEGGNYVNHFTNTWRALLVPQGNNQLAQAFGGQIDTWVRGHVRDNTPYDKMVHELLTTQIRVDGTQPRVNTGALAFFQANEYKVEELAAATSRVFLGVKIECAQCHDHPFANWKRKQFWEYAAFFAGIKRENRENAFGPVSDDTKLRELFMPHNDKLVQATFLDGTEPKWEKDSQTRTVLANWMTNKNNPYFAKAAANRMWEHFFGIGLVDPVDDMREDNPPSHPELLAKLANRFVENGFDTKFLIRAITASKTYQRTAMQTDKSQEDLRLFARVPLKGLTGDQIFNSLATATGYRGDASSSELNFRLGLNSPRGEIVSKFTNPVDRKTEWQTSILQALALMNGRFVSDATSLERSETLAAIVDKRWNTRQKLDTLFLAALSRPMNSSEATKLMSYVESGGPSRDQNKALADVFWVLLNSSEFILNH